MRDPFDPTPPEAPAAPAVAADETAAHLDESTPEPADESSETAVDALDSAATDAAGSDEADDEVWEADEVLAGSLDQARSALELITPADTIGEPLGYIVEGEHVLSLLFDCLMTGYPGWRWTVSLSRVDGDSEPQVLETELTPGDDALLAPEWVPWSDRLADVKVAEELAAAGLGADDSDDDPDDDDESEDDDSDDDSEDDDDSDEDGSDGSDGSDDASDRDADGLDFDEALAVSEQLTASEQNEDETGQAEAETDDGAPQPPAQARGMQFSAEDNG